MPQLTPEFARHFALVLGMVIVFALVLGIHPFKRKRVVASAQWTASDYHAYLQASIKTSPNMKELNKVRPLVEKYYDRHFRVPISDSDRKRYYIRLLKALAAKEKKLKEIEGCAS